MQDDWVDGYSLRHYPGRIYAEGVSTLVNMLMDAPEPLTLISIAPLPNIAAALDLEPRIAQHARIVGMHGSLRRGYAGSALPTAEYNVKVDVPACRKSFLHRGISPSRRWILAASSACTAISTAGCGMPGHHLPKR